MTEKQRKFIERLAEECIKNDHGHQDHVDKHKYNFFIAGATNEKIIEMYRAQFLEELADRMNIAHTSEPGLFPEFGTPEWMGAAHFKVYLANKLWIEAEGLAALLGEGDR